MEEPLRGTVSSSTSAALLALRPMLVAGMPVNGVTTLR